MDSLYTIVLKSLSSGLPRHHGVHVRPPGESSRLVRELLFYLLPSPECSVRR